MDQSTTQPGCDASGVDFATLDRDQICGIVEATAWLLSRLPEIGAPADADIKRATDLLLRAHAAACER